MFLILHNEQYSGDQIKNETGKACSTYGRERKGACRVLVRKHKGSKPLGRRRRRWEDSIKMDLRKVGCGCMDRIDLAQDRD